MQETYNDGTTTETNQPSKQDVLAAYDRLTQGLTKRFTVYLKGPVQEKFYDPKPVRKRGRTLYISK